MFNYEKVKILKKKFRNLDIDSMIDTNNANIEDKALMKIKRSSIGKGLIDYYE